MAIAGPGMSGEGRGAEAPARYVGQRVLRVENPPLLKGVGQFIDDLPVKKGTLHAAILRSPLPHADIAAIDVAAALQCPGVKAVITGKDVAALTDPLIVGFATPMEYYGIAVDRVRYVGEPVAIVCATDRYLAEDALEHIRVDYRPLDAVVDPIRAAQPDAPVLHPGGRVERRLAPRIPPRRSGGGLCGRQAQERHHHPLSAQLDHADRGLLPSSRSICPTPAATTCCRISRGRSRCIR